MQGEEPEMTEFPVHHLETSTGARREALEKVAARYGYVPNVIGVMAESPGTAEMYLAMGGALYRGVLSPAELQVAWFAINDFNGCDYCMAAHTVASKVQNIPEEVIATARAGAPYEDPRLEALRRFTLAMLEKRGWVSPEEVETFLAAGFDKAAVFEVILAIAQKTISNYANHIAHTPLDARYRPHEWHRAEAAE